MTGVVLPWPKRSVPRRLGPVPAVLTGSQVLEGPRGPLLELRLTMPLADVPAAQRRPLAVSFRQPCVTPYGFLE